MTLSDYELQRLANIARNQNILDELGLGDDNSLKEKKPKPLAAARNPKHDDDDDDKPKPTCRVTRNQGVRTYVKLSDDFMCMEETGLLKRAKRETKKPAPRYDEIQAAEVALRDQKRARKMQQQAAEKIQRERMQRMMSVAAQQQTTTTNQPVLQRLLGCVPRTMSAVWLYPTKNPRVTCPSCNGKFVLLKNGRIHKHDGCVNTTPWVPSFV